MSNLLRPSDINGLSMMDPFLIFQVEKLFQRPVLKHANVFNTITCTFSQQLSYNGVTRVPKAAPDQTWPSWSAILRQSPGNSYPALHKYKPNRNRPQDPHPAPLTQSFPCRQKTERKTHSRILNKMSIWWGHFGKRSFFPFSFSFFMFFFFCFFGQARSCNGPGGLVKNGKNQIQLHT